MEILDNGAQPLDNDDLADSTWSHPATLALTSLILGILTMLGAGVLRGTAYTLAFGPHDNGLGQVSGNLHNYQLAGAVLSALFAMVPVLIAKRGLGRLVPSDSTVWGHVLRTAMIVSATSLVLHAVQILVVLQSNNTNGVPLLAG